MTVIENFGKNIEFAPENYFEPENEDAVLEILRQNQDAQIRVVGSRHAWSEGIETEDVLICLKNMNSVEIIRDGENSRVRVGAGCQVKKLLAELQMQGMTLPSVGLITEQTIAGATATGTHGSGKQSLSHFIQAARVACYPNGQKNNPELVDIVEGDELRAARCSLGCLGVVVSLELPCVEQYSVCEKIKNCETIDEVLELEKEWPLQQFFLFPYRWNYSVQCRKLGEKPKSWSAPFYRGYWWLGLDILFHLVLLLMVRVLRTRTLVRVFYRYVLGWFVINNWKVTDRSDRMLVMEHELFRHLELEAFVKKEKLPDALEFVKCVLRQADGTSDSQMADRFRDQLEKAGLTEKFDQLKGVFTHHYPICVRRILKDDTLISMASGESDCWYALSFITYVRPREPFYQLATFLAESIFALFEGRIHWGKWFPLQADTVRKQYPQLPEFRNVCQKFDPDWVFQNRFTRRVLSGDSID